MSLAPVAVDGEGVYLRSYLAPLTGMLARPDVTDIYVNRPGELWVETSTGEIERHDAPRLDEATLGRLARQIAALSHQGISREHPLLSATLPDGARVQVVAPPATRGPLALAISKHVSPDLALDDYVAAGAFAETRGRKSTDRSEIDRALAAQLAAGDIAGMLAAAVKARKNILVSGGTSSGKTTFLNALIREIPAEERLILIEDTPELFARHENIVGLLAARSALGEAQVTANDLLAASLRMRPDRIISGRAARRRGVRLPARDQHRPSRIDDHGPRRQRRAGDRADRAARAPGRHPAQPRRHAPLCRPAPSTCSSSSTGPAGAGASPKWC